MGLIYQEPWQVVKSYLLATLTAAALPGRELAGIAIETVAPPASGVSNTLGFQFRSNADSLSGQGRTTSVFSFEFDLILERSFDPLQADAVKQIAQRAENLWNDGAGNGLGALLNSDPTLGGNVFDFSLNHQIVIGRDVLDESETSAVLVAQMVARAERNTFA